MNPSSKASRFLWRPLRYLLMKYAVCSVEMRIWQIKGKKQSETLILIVKYVTLNHRYTGLHAVGLG